MYLIGASSAGIRETGYRWRYEFLKKAGPAWFARRFARATRDAPAMQMLEITETNLPMFCGSKTRIPCTFGIETRLPFLDYRLVEFALALSR